MTEAAEDEDMIVILIGEDDEKDVCDQHNSDDIIIDEVTGEMISTKHIKKEVNLDETLDEDLFHVVEKYGTPIDMPVPFAKKENKEEGFQYEYLDENSEDEDYVPEEEDEASDKEDPVFKHKHTKKATKNIAYEHRFKLLSPNESHSFVDELRKLYPNFVDDQEALVMHLATMMKALKPPAPPDGYCEMIGEKCYVCSICEKITETKAASERHYAEKHGPRYLHCYSCGVDFRCLTNLYKHEKRCLHPDAEYVLRARAICVGFKGSNRPFLMSYQSRALTTSQQKTTQRFECAICNSVFRSKDNLEAHELLHAGVRPFKCDQCESSYTSKSKLKRHALRHNDTNRFECDICGRVYPIKTHLVSHMNSHDARRFLCPYGCGRKYASNFALRIHIDKKHLQKEPPCACNICPKRFFKMSLLKVHMKKAHGLLLMTRNMLIKQLPRMDPSKVKAMFGDMAAYIHKGNTDSADLSDYKLMHSDVLDSSDTLDINRMEIQQFDPEEDDSLITVAQVDFDGNIITGDLTRRYTSDMPELDNPHLSDDAQIITGDYVNFSDEFSEDLVTNSQGGITFRVKIKKENYEDVTQLQDMELEEALTNNKYKVNINEEGVVTIKEEVYEIPVCQNISIEEVLKSNRKFKVVMVNK